jgi:DNA-binding protein Fis
MIMKVLAETNGHQQRAADLLGISRRTLSRKLKLYGMEAAQSFAS